jgi:outer membrane protein
MIKLLILIILSFSILYSQSSKKEKVSIGLGPYVQSQPYKNVDNMLLPSPVFFYDNQIFYVRWTRLGVYFLGNSSKDFSWGFSLSAQPRTNSYSPEDSLELKDMQEKKSSYEGGVVFSAVVYEAYFELMYMYDLLDRYNAHIVNAELGYPIKIEKLSIYPSIIYEYQSKDFLNYYYGVSQEESISSSHNIFTPDAGVKLAAQTYVYYPLTDDFSAFLNAKINFLPKEVKDSPLLDKDYFYSAFASIIYTFEY